MNFKHYILNYIFIGTIYLYMYVCVYIYIYIYISAVPLRINTLITFLTNVI